MGSALQRAWLRRGGLAVLLWPLSLLYRLVSGTVRWLYRAGLLQSESAGVPVVVIGNVVAGGAGKTPVLIAVARHLEERGLRVGVVSRGHGRSGTGCIEVTSRSSAQEAGDEPVLIARRCAVPVFVAGRRIEAVRALRKAHPQVQVVLSDDGLQHAAMARDIEICVFDDRGVGNGWLLPAGPLREPWPRAVDLVLRTEAAAALGGFVVTRRLAEVALRADGARMALDTLARDPCDAVAGIAQPEAFFAMLRQRGLRLRRTVALADHHAFSGDAGLAQPGTALLCTEKDAVKLWRSEPQAWAVPLEVDIEPAFWAALEGRLGPRLSSKHGPETA